MRPAIVIGIAALALIAAGCSKKAANTAGPAAATPAAAASASATTSASPAGTLPTAPAASGPELSGTYTGNGAAAALTQVTAHTSEPFDGKPVTVLVFTAKDQAGDPKADFNALFGKFGDAIIVRIQPDGNVIGTDVVHSGLKSPSGSISISGPISLKDYQNAGGQISGHLTSNGPVDVFDQKITIDLTFHTKAP